MLLPTVEEMFAASTVVEAAAVSVQQSQPMMVGTMAVGKAVTFGSTNILGGPSSKSTDRCRANMALLTCRHVGTLEFIFFLF